MIKNSISLVAMLTAAVFYGQVGIGTTSVSSSEVLRINSQLGTETGKRGVLIPRVTLTGVSDNTTVPNPVPFLMVYNITPGAKGFYYWNPTLNAGTGGWERSFDKDAVLDLIVPMKNEINLSTGLARRNSGTNALAVPYTVGVSTGETPTTPRTWTLLPNLTKTVSIYSNNNNVTISASGSLQLNNLAFTSGAPGNPVESYAIGLFLDDRLFSVRTYVASGNQGMTCYSESFDIKANLQNLSQGSHTFSVYAIPRNHLSGSATNLTWVGTASGCSNLNDFMTKGVLAIQTQQF